MSVSSHLYIEGILKPSLGLVAHSKFSMCVFTVSQVFEK